MNQRVRLPTLIAVAAFLLVLLYVGMSRRAPVEVNSGYRVIMGTFSRMVVLADSDGQATACIEAAFDQQRRVDALMSYHNGESELNRVNRLAAGEPVAVNERTFDVLQQAVRFSTLSDGAFDVTVGPLVDLWRSAGEANEPPSEAALAEGRRKVGYEKLILDADERTLRFAVEGMRVDLGGIAKGYAIDQSIAAMKQRGAVGGMVDIGGDVRCFGRPPKGQTHWRIGLQDPTVPPDDLVPGTPLLVLQLSDGTVTTSGDYRRFTEVKGRRQSHIMDTQTGRGANKLVSVTIIAPDATTADALATAVSVLGREKGLALIEQLDGVEAILIPAESGTEPVFSSGAAAYVR